MIAIKTLYPSLLIHINAKVEIYHRAVLMLSVTYFDCYCTFITCIHKLFSGVARGSFNFMHARAQPEQNLTLLLCLVIGNRLINKLLFFLWSLHASIIRSPRLSMAVLKHLKWSRGKENLSEPFQSLLDIP